MPATVTAIINQKGGTGKTCTCANLGVGLAREGKKVLLVDFDPQSSLTISLGYDKPDDLPVTVATLMSKVLDSKLVTPGEGILHQQEAVDLIPSCIELSGVEAATVNALSRENLLKQILAPLRKQYDHILIDCSPSLSMLNLNALSAADNVIIPVQPQYLSAKGLVDLLNTIKQVRNKINPRLKTEGIVLTMVDNRTNLAKEIGSLVRNTYGKHINIFSTEIPMSVRAAEASAAGVSIHTYDPKGKVAEAYRNLTKEVLSRERQRQKAKSACI